MRKTLTRVTIVGVLAAAAAITTQQYFFSGENSQLPAPTRAAYQHSDMDTYLHNFGDARLTDADSDGLVDIIQTENGSKAYIYQGYEHLFPDEPNGYNCFHMTDEQREAASQLITDRNDLAYISAKVKAEQWNERIQKKR